MAIQIKTPAFHLQTCMPHFINRKSSPFCSILVQSNNKPTFMSPFSPVVFSSDSNLFHARSSCKHISIQGSDIARFLQQHLSPVSFLRLLLVGSDFLQMSAERKTLQNHSKSFPKICKRRGTTMSRGSFRMSGNML